MADDSKHWDVGAYVLGVLDPADIGTFEVHLATCDSCADQVASLLPVVDLLPTADAATLLVERAQPRSWGPTPSIAPALTWQGRSGPRHGLATTPVRRTGRMTVAASILAAAVAGGSFVAGSNWSTSDAAVALPPVALTRSGEAATTNPPTDGQRMEATDPITGANAQLTVATTAWGSQIELSLGGVRGPLRCQLVAVGADASTTVVASWLVTVPGYGILGQPNRLRVQAATAVTLASTSHFEIRATSPDGHVSRLVSIPA